MDKCTELQHCRIGSVFVFFLFCICICWLKLDVGGSGVRVLALMDTVPSVKLETFGQWGARVNTAKYTNSCPCTRFHLPVARLLLIAGIAKR